VWKESDKQLTRGSEFNRVVHVLMCKVWVFEKENVTVFDVITFHIRQYVV